MASQAPSNQWLNRDQFQQLVEQAANRPVGVILSAKATKADHKHLRRLLCGKGRCAEGEKTLIDRATSKANGSHHAGAFTLDELKVAILPNFSSRKAFKNYYSDFPSAIRVNLDPKLLAEFVAFHEGAHLGMESELRDWLKTRRIPLVLKQPGISQNVFSELLTTKNDLRIEQGYCDGLASLLLLKRYGFAQGSKESEQVVALLNKVSSARDRGSVTDNFAGSAIREALKVAPTVIGTSDNLDLRQLAVKIATDHYEPRLPGIMQLRSKSMRFGNFWK